jgi:hypothetical protein
MTLEEVATAEQLAGVAIDEMLDDEKLKGKSLTALVYVIKKRNDAAFTMDDAKKYTLRQALDIVKGKVEDPKAS